MARGQPRSFVRMECLCLFLIACLGSGAQARHLVQQMTEMLPATACAVPVPEPAACEPYANTCGHPISCECPYGYEYDQRLGLSPAGGCLLLGYDREVTPGAAEREECVLSLSGPGGLPAFCTSDFTECGGSSRCSCPSGYQYSPQLMKCLRGELP
mmetsp:Transcript_28668/g.80717  ORF Transcript_28668/g.80717 Transcript_28668/m.80717 type:complete len:156 (+) Transcript_28668:226-693(+)